MELLWWLFMSSEQESNDGDTTMVDAIEVNVNVKVDPSIENGEDEDTRTESEDEDTRAESEFTQSQYEAEAEVLDLDPFDEEEQNNPTNQNQDPTSGPNINTRGSLDPFFEPNEELSRVEIVNTDSRYACARTCRIDRPGYSCHPPQGHGHHTVATSQE